MFLGNIGLLPTDYTVLYPRTHNSSTDIRPPVSEARDMNTPRCEHLMPDFIILSKCIILGELPWHWME
jgi:hypothetical protein